MKEPCKACGCSGIYIDYGGYSTGGIAAACKVCNGSGWVDGDDVVTVPRKYVIKEYWEVYKK